MNMLEKIATEPVTRRKAIKYTIISAAAVIAPLLVMLLKTRNAWGEDAIEELWQER